MTDPRFLEMIVGAFLTAWMLWAVFTPLTPYVPLAAAWMTP
jgi:hypothetical protein